MRCASRMGRKIWSTRQEIKEWRLQEIKEWRLQRETGRREIP